MTNTNGFEKHNIDHSSPSSINMWSNAPCAWAAKYLYGRKFKYGLAPKAGILVEGLRKSWKQKTKQQRSKLNQQHKQHVWRLKNSERLTSIVSIYG